MRNVLSIVVIVLLAMVLTGCDFAPRNQVSEEYLEEILVALYDSDIGKVEDLFGSESDYGYLEDIFNEFSGREYTDNICVQTNYHGEIGETNTIETVQSGYIVNTESGKMYVYFEWTSTHGEHKLTRLTVKWKD